MAFPFCHITAAWAVDREVVSIEFGNWVDRPAGCGPARVGGRMSAVGDPLGALLGRLWSPFGSLWGALDPL